MPTCKRWRSWVLEAVTGRVLRHGWVIALPDRGALLLVSQFKMLKTVVRDSAMAALRLALGLLLSFKPPLLS